MSMFENPMAFLTLHSEAPNWVKFDGFNADHMELNLTATVALPDGAPSVYRLVIHQPDILQPFLVVLEHPDHRRLPAWCPERHITPGGHFCLGWGPSKFAHPTTIAQAREWWGRLAGYLAAQDTCTLTGRWPRGQSWPHGSPAKQQELEALEAGLTPSELAMLDATPVRPQPRRPLAMVNRRSPCACGSGKPWRACHEAIALQRQALQAGVQRADARFWQLMAESGRTCCGQVRDCPLATMVPPEPKEIPCRPT